MSNENYQIPEQDSSANSVDESSKLLLADTNFFQPTNQNIINDLGIIDNLVVPASWTKEATNDTLIAHPKHMDFRRDESTLLSFRERGFRVSEAAGSRFTQTLSRPLNAKTNQRQIDLKSVDSAKEFSELNPILADDLASNKTFRADSVRVLQINGRNVLEISGMRGKTTETGEWKSSGIKVSSIYIDKFGKGDAIQEIRLETSTNNFEKHRADIDKLLGTIKWKDAALK